MWLRSVRDIRCWPQRELLLLAGLPQEKGSMEPGYTPERPHKWTTLARQLIDWPEVKKVTAAYLKSNTEVSISAGGLNDPRGGGCDTGSSCDLSTLQWIFYSQPIGAFPLLEVLVNTGAGTLQEPFLNTLESRHCTFTRCKLHLWNRKQHCCDIYKIQNQTIGCWSSVLRIGLHGDGCYEAVSARLRLL